MIRAGDVAAQVHQRPQPFDLRVDRGAVLAKTRLSMPPTPRSSLPYWARQGAMLASHVPTSMGNIVFTPFSSQIGISLSIFPSQSRETMLTPWSLRSRVMRR